MLNDKCSALATPTFGGLRVFWIYAVVLVVPFDRYALSISLVQGLRGCDMIVLYRFEAH